MVNKDKLVILQFNTRKLQKDVMIRLFKNEQIKKMDILELQEPWQNLWQYTTYQSLKRFFDLVYKEDRINICVCFYINKALALAPWSFTYHSSSFCSLYLKTFNGRIIQIHNICNQCNSNLDDQHASTIPTLVRTIELHANEKHILLEDFNLYHPV